MFLMRWREYKRTILGGKGELIDSWIFGPRRTISPCGRYAYLDLEGFKRRWGRVISMRTRRDGLIDLEAETEGGERISRVIEGRYMTVDGEPLMQLDSLVHPQISRARKEAYTPNSPFKRGSSLDLGFIGSEWEKRP